MKNFKLNWGHGVAIMLGGFMIFILTLIFTAGDTGSLVTDEYYEESLVYQEESLDAQNRVNTLTSKPQFKSQANGILIQFPKDLKPTDGTVQLLRASDISKDIKVALNLNKQNQMLLPAAKLIEGEYDISLFWTLNNKKYLIKKTIQWNMR